MSTTEQVVVPARGADRGLARRPCGSSSSTRRSWRAGRAGSRRRSTRARAARTAIEIVPGSIASGEFVEIDPPRRHRLHVGLGARTPTGRTSCRRARRRSRSSSCRRAAARSSCSRTATCRRASRPIATRTAGTTTSSGSRSRPPAATPGPIRGSRAPRRASPETTTKRRERTMGKYVLALQGRQHAGDRGGAEERHGRVDRVVRRARRARSSTWATRSARRRRSAAAPRRA